VAIIQALGRLRDVPSVAALKREAAAEDRDIRIAALDALANIGDIAAAETILAAAGSAQDFWEKQRATEDALTLAKRLGEAQHKPDAEQIYRTLWEKRTDRQVRIAALVGLTELRGDLADVLAAMKTGDPQIRAVAISLATATPGQAATLKCVAAMEQAAPSDRASLLEILGARADPAALPAILKMFKFPDEQVRSAAMLAAAAIGGEGAAEAIVACVCGAPGKDRDAAVIALGKMSGKEAGTAVAGALKQASDPAVKVALLTVVAARRQTDMADAAAGAVADSDPAVRAAAIRALGAIGGDKQLPALVAILKAPKDAKDQRAAEDALVAACARNLGDRCTDLLAPALADAPPATAASILRVLGAAGSRKAMEAVAAATKSASAETKDAAVRVLAGWPGKEAAPAMLAVAQNSDNPKHRVLVLRGIVRLAALKDTPAADSAKLLGEAMKSAKTPDEKREVLGGLSAVKTVEALQTAAACLDDEAIREEAAAAVVQIAEGLAKQEPAAVRDAVGKAAKATKNDQLRASAERILARVKK
jgi:HEAT repeat protein